MCSPLRVGEWPPPYMAMYKEKGPWAGKGGAGQGTRHCSTPRGLGVTRLSWGSPGGACSKQGARSDHEGLGKRVPGAGQDKGGG